MMTCQEDLCGLARENAEGRHAANGVAREKRSEGTPERQMRTGLHAEPPAFGAKRETRSLKRENDGQPPAHALDAVEHSTDACALEDVGKKCEARDGVEGNGETPAQACAHLTRWAGIRPVSALPE